VVASADELAKALAEIGTPAVLKTAAFGYDGKGQQKLTGDEELAEVWANFGTDRAVLEAFIPFERELSVMVARSGDGSVVAYDPAENRHRHHILDVSIVPARVSPAVLAEAKVIACQVADALEYEGIMGVEFFHLPDGSLLVKWRRVRTTPATTRWMPARHRNSSSRCASSVACRRVRRSYCRRW
jgi:5-(carboxyamino)imidazole ribonucleotide synthase